MGRNAQPNERMEEADGPELGDGPEQAGGPERIEAQELPGSSAATVCSERSPAVSYPYPYPSPSSFVYAIGRVDPRFPSLAVEKEFLQATSQVHSAGRTDRQVLQAFLADRAGRYLARQMCWVFTVEGMETYILAPRDPADLDLLIEAVRPEPQSYDVDVAIGLRGPIASPGACNGLLVPVVLFDQLYSFDRDELIRELPRPDGQEEDAFRATAEEVFDRIGRMVDNAGATDEHRALNYLAVRYPAIYARAVESHALEEALTEVEVHPSPLSGTRDIMDVVFSYTNRRTDVVAKYFVRVDVTEEFPFLVTKLSPYFDCG